MSKHSKDNNNQEEKQQEKTFNYETRRPTYTHEALYKLLEEGHIKHIISQNTDGLHRLSGVAKYEMVPNRGGSEGNTITPNFKKVVYNFGQFHNPAEEDNH